VDSRWVADVWFEPTPGGGGTRRRVDLSSNQTAGWGQLREDAGLALRFPRFTGRWRDDKAPEDATSVTEAVWG
jgi:DNA ligase-1